MSVVEEKFYPYKLLTRCGRGAYGDVYIAEDAVGRRIALKTVERSVAAAREISGLRHYARIGGSGNLIRIFHIEEREDLLYYTMELADDLNPGNTDPAQYIPATLGNLMTQKKRLAPADVKRIASELLSGLRDLHENQLIHRDIKPENILMVNGIAKLSDIGLVSDFNHSISIGGTLGFIPPERLKSSDGNQTREDDLYATGKVLYCLLTGYPPEKYPQIPPELIRDPDVRNLNNVITTACSRTPHMRFRDAGEFAQALTRGKVSSRRKFLKWAQYLVCSFAALCAVALAVTAWIQFPKWKEAYQTLQSARRTAYEQLLKTNADFARKLLTNRAPLEIQLSKLASPGEIRQFFQKLRSIPDLHPEKGKIVRTECIHFLEEKALQSLPVLPESSGAFMEDMKRSGQARILPHSILGNFLSPEQKTILLEQISDWEKQHLLHHWQGSLLPGKTLVDDDVRWNVFAYIPPGEFDSVFTGTRQKVDYPIWVSEKEILAEDFVHKVEYEPNKQHGTVNQPVVYITWNDVLEYCRRATLKMQEYGKLPPGYIIRPLTETEWEWCMRGAWQGDIAPGDSISTPNGAGVYKLKQCDEYVLNTSPGKLQPNTVQLMRKSIHKNKLNTVQWRKIDHYYYQSFYNGSAFRTAIAPGDLSSFAKEIRWKIEPQSFDTADRHFEVISSTISAEKAEAISRFCRLLGGRLAVLDTPEIRQKANRFLCVSGWPVLVAGEYKDNAWRWPDGRLIPDPPEKPSKAVSIFCFRNGKFSKFAHAQSPAFICEWTQKEWQNRFRRADRWQHSMVKKRFTVDGREFVVIAYHTNIGNFETFARILGGKPVTPHPGKFRERLFEELAEFDQPVILGGHFFFGTWRSHDLTEMGKHKQIPPRGRIFCQSPYLQTLAIYQKELCRTQSGAYFLLEIKK